MESQSLKNGYLKPFLSHYANQGKANIRTTNQKVRGSSPFGRAKEKTVLCLSPNSLFSFTIF